MVKWKFEPKRRSQKSRDPMQASFFTNSSIDDDTHALVREAIQNSLDAKSKFKSQDPVRVRFYIGCHAATTEVMSRYLPNDAWEHFNAPDNGLSHPPGPNDDCRYLVYEDFNTEGLVGDPFASEAQPGNSFYYFMRAEGQSGKEEGERGRHGIGKYVFPYTSGIRMFIAATVRNSDNRCLIAGQSVLKYHNVRDQIYTPDGWWGAFEKDGENDFFQLPTEDQEIFHQLKIDFCLMREQDQSGLSLIMPYIQDDVTIGKISEHVIREYFWPILDDQLIVEVVENDVEKTIDSDTIHLNLDELLPQEQLEKISPYIDLAFKGLSKTDNPSVELLLPDIPSVPLWSPSYLTKEISSNIQSELGKENSFICIRCPLHVKKSDEINASQSHFDIFLSKDTSDIARKPLFIREGITIPEDRVPTVRGYISIVVIKPGNLATLLGDAENPAHTEWEKNATKFKDKYRWGAKTIDFVRLSVSKLLKLLSQGDEDNDVTVLSDIFYLNLPEDEEEVPETRKRKEKKARGTEPEPPPTPDPIHKPQTYRLTKTKDGFVINGPTSPLAGPRTYKVKVAYDFSGASKVRALKRYHKNDFDIKKEKNVYRPITENLKELEIGGNTVSFVAYENDFKLEINGFDPRRDIIVDVKSEAVTDEAI